ncbi:hypothetical protein ACHAXR_006905 [Thalassiosira sp. AJA248-18]
MAGPTSMIMWARNSLPERMVIAAYLGGTAVCNHKCHSYPRVPVVSSLSPSSRILRAPPVLDVKPFGNASVRSSDGQSYRPSMMMMMAREDGGGKKSSRGSGRNENGRGGDSNRNRHRSKNRQRTTRRRPPPPPVPPPGQPGRQCFRSCIEIGADVYVVKKNHQRTGQETRGVVSRLLTKSAYHPRGIKVMLVGGEVGRVTRFPGDNDTAPVNNAGNNDAVTSGRSNRFNKISLVDWLSAEEVDRNLSRVIMAAADASCRVAMDLRNLSLMDNDMDMDKGGNVNVQGEEQKSMDVRANKIFIQQLKPVVAAMVSEEEEDIVPGDVANDHFGGSETTVQYSIAFDPLDGSSNLDVGSPTGSIFGIFRNHGTSGNSISSPFESPARQSMVAAGYTIYSSTTDLVLAGGFNKNAVVGFTLDVEDGTFRCSRPNIVCPGRGPYYSLNEAREPDWPDGLRQWISDAKRGQTPSGSLYSARYVCSLTADFHRTLLKGGWAGNPRPHLRLLYEAAPLAFIAEAARGAGSDGVRNLLDIKPAFLHHRVSCFLGSKLEIEDLKGYGNVQQKSKHYES